MKRLLFTLIIFLPITLQAGWCTENFHLSQESNYQDYLLQLDDCESNPDCEGQAYDNYLDASLLNTATWVGCCTLGPLVC